MDETLKRLIGLVRHDLRGGANAAACGDDCFLANLQGSDLCARCVFLGGALALLLASESRLLVMVLALALASTLACLYVTWRHRRQVVWLMVRATVIGALAASLLSWVGAQFLVVLTIALHVLVGECLLVRFIWNVSTKLLQWQEAQWFKSVRPVYAEIGAHYIAASFVLSCLLCRSLRGFRFDDGIGYYCARCRRSILDVSVRTVDGDDEGISAWPTWMNPLFLKVGSTGLLFLGDRLSEWLHAEDTIDLFSRSCRTERCGARADFSRSHHKRCLVLAVELGVAQRALAAPLRSVGATRSASIDTEEWSSGARRIVVRTDHRTLHLEIFVIGDSLFRPSILEYDACLLLHSGQSADSAYSVSPWMELGSLVGALRFPSPSPVKMPENREEWASLFHRGTRYMFKGQPEQPPGSGTDVRSLEIVLVPIVEVNTIPHARGVVVRSAETAGPLLDSLLQGDPRAVRTEAQLGEQE